MNLREQRKHNQRRKSEGEERKRELLMAEWW